MAKIPIDNFDKFIRDKAEMHRTPVDTDRLWSNIQKSGSSRKSSILPGALLLLLITFFISVHLLNNDFDFSNQLANQSDSNYNLPGTSRSKITTQAAIQPASVANTVSKNMEFSDDQIVSVVNTQSTANPVSEIGISKKGFSPIANLTPTIIHSKQANETNKSELKNEIIAADTQLSEPIASSEIVELLTNEVRSEHINNEIENALNDAIVQLLDITEFKELESDLFFPAMKQSKGHIIRIQHAAPGIGYELRLSAGVGKVFKNMALINPEAAKWMQARTDNEHPLEALRLGMDMKFKVSNNVYFFAGLEDFRVNERFDYFSVQEITYRKEGQASRVIYDENSFVIENGAVDVIEEIKKRGTFYNQFRMINIPVGIGLSQQFGRFGLGIEGAILVNVYHEFDGKMANAQNTLIDLNEAPFRVSQIQTVRLGGFLSYRMSSKWGLSLNTGADLPVRSIQLDQHMSQSYTVWQTNLGISYYW